jgi:segregation and condensation protein A
MQFEVQEEVNPEYDESDDSRFSDDLYYQDYYADNVIPIEDIIKRRTSVKLNRNRIVTLKDLIRQLEFYEQLDKKQAVKNSLERAKRRVRSYANMSADDIINLAHEEYIESSVKILHENLVKIFEKEEKVELNTLTLLGLDKISAYIALLFLSAESEFDLEQEEFYSDLYVVKGKAPNRDFTQQTA